MPPPFRWGFFDMFRIQTNELSFPHPRYADEDGVLAVGGDLSIDRLLLAYANGIFPWFNSGEPIIWWSPDPRMVLYPDDLKISKSMKPVLKQHLFEIRYDTAFEQVMRHCAAVPRIGQSGTWITDDMLTAYAALHQAGYAHSVEAWQNGELVGGLYGVSLGRCFFGESMFTKVSNASKAAFIHLVQKLKEKGFELIDCQVHTSHLQSLGAREIPRADFLAILEGNKNEKTLQGSWHNIF